MAPAVVGRPGSVMARALQLEVLVEVGWRMTGHLLQAARPELISWPPVCFLLLLPENMKKVRPKAGSQARSSIR